jgi:menaquinol-cytochrome c reductase iron-sulfur subunit
MSGSDHLSRRDFVTWISASVGTLIAAFVGLPALDYLIAPSLTATSTNAWIPLGKLDSFEVGKPVLSTFTRSKVNGWEKTVNSYGVFVFRKSQTEVVAYSNVCTHLGCRVNWQVDKKEYICPCHDGHFNINGQVVSGPPPRPLDTYATKVSAGVLSIHFLES